MAYEDVVLATPALADYWKLAEASGTVAADSKGTDTGTYQSGVTLGQAGSPGSALTAALFGGGGYVSTANQISNGATPPYSVECWFKTTASGVLIAFANNQTGTPSNYGPMLYVGSDSKLYFGFYNGSSTQTVNTSGSVANGQWHHAVGVTYASNNFSLYLDGALVGTNTQTVAPQTFNGYWRLGQGGSGGWPATPGNFTGTLAHAAVYSGALNGPAINRHYLSQPAPPTAPMLVDASTPAPAFAAGAISTVTSNSFSPPANSLVVLFAGDDGNSLMGAVTSTAGLTWRPLIRGNGSGGAGEAGIWVADVPATAPGSMTVTVAFPGGANNGFIAPLVLTGAAPAGSQTGSVAAGSALFAVPSVTVTTTANGSRVFAAIYLWNGSRGIPSGQTSVFNGIDFLVGSGPRSALVQSTTATTPSGGTPVTISETTSIAGPVIVAEILAADALVGPTQTISPPGIASGQAFGAATVRLGVQPLAPTGVPSSQALGTLRIATLWPVLPSGIGSGEAFGGALVGIHLNLRPTGIPSAVAFGDARVALKRFTTAVLTPTGIGSVGAVGTPTVGRGAVTIRPVGIATAEALGFGGIGRPIILPKPTGAASLSLMLVRRSGLRH